jgi:hypothetical protein
MQWREKKLSPPQVCRLFLRHNCRRFTATLMISSGTKPSKVSIRSLCICPYQHLFFWSAWSEKNDSAVTLWNNSHSIITSPVLWERIIFTRCPLLVVRTLSKRWFIKSFYLIKDTTYLRGLTLGITEHGSVGWKALPHGNICTQICAWNFAPYLCMHVLFWWLVCITGYHTLCSTYMSYCCNYVPPTTLQLIWNTFVSLINFRCP